MSLEHQPAPDPPIPFAPEVRELVEPPAPAEALLRLGGRAGTVLLHSGGGSPARWSVLGFDPALDLTTDREAGPDAPPARTMAAALAAIEAALARLAPAPAAPIPGPFHGGFLGALAYDLGVRGARLDLPTDLPPEPFDQPLLVGGIYTDFVVWDHDADRAWLVTASAQRAESAAAELACPSSAPPVHLVRPFERATSPAEHRAHVDAVRASIHAGDLYQANLSHRLTGELSGTPEAAYRQLAAANPVPYGGFARFPGGALLSASMELLVEVDERGSEPRLASTRPIKGTVRRGTDAAEDERLAAGLMASAKDRAELAMIVDLERNDLGRVARTGGVRVDAFPRLESYASVHHLVADVVAELALDVTTPDVLAALFPGGSITGAPKLASMERIAELEDTARGFFTGSLGFVDHRGAACFNILIRSPLWRDGDEAGGGELSLSVGGGITWASEPAAEDDETLHKAASLLGCFRPASE